MKYFCPIRNKWFKYLGDGNLNYSGYLSPEGIRADAADQTIIDKWNSVPVPPAPELKSVAGDPIVKSYVDKFYKTKLEEILKKKVLKLL